MKVEFSKISNKLAFFDFDRTLVAHRYSREYMDARNEGYFKECVYALMALDEEHKNDRPLPCMQWYVKKLYDEGYGLYVLTHEIFNLRDQLKKSQLEQFYAGIPMTYFTVDAPEHKIDMMRAVAAAEKCDLSDVIFVDDMLSTVNMALNAGIDAKHLSDIVVLYETQHDHQEQDSLIRLDDAGSFTDFSGEMYTDADDMAQDTDGDDGTSFLEEVARRKMEKERNEPSEEEMELAYRECCKVVEKGLDVI